MTAATQAGRREQIQECDNLPVSSAVAPKECKQIKDMQIDSENSFMPLTTSRQKCEKKINWLKKTNNMLHKSLNSESEKYKVETEKVWKTVEIQTSSNAVQKHGDIVREALRDSDTKVNEAYNSSSSKNKSVVPSGKDCSEQDSVVAESRIHEQQKVSIYDT